MNARPSRRSIASLALAACSALVVPASGAAGLVAPPHEIRGMFSLVRQDGVPMTERDLLGRPSIVLFGFTHCPDVCPTSLMELTVLLQEMGPKADGVRVAFVAVDHERDTPQVLREYMSQFDPRIVALSGDEGALRRAIDSFRAFAEKIPREDGFFTYDHSAVVYLNDREGIFREELALRRGNAAAIRQIEALM